MFNIGCECQNCHRLIVFLGKFDNSPESYGGANLDDIFNSQVEIRPIRYDVATPHLQDSIPERVRDLFLEALTCRRLQKFEAAGAMFRKTIDVATKLLFQTDARLQERKPADALRSRLKALGEMKILDEDIVELADVAALDGNDAVHDMDPYTAEEAEALEELTSDLLDRLYVRPAKLAAVRAKQIAAGQRKA